MARHTGADTEAWGTGKSSTAVGDPHVTNIRGERFGIRRAGSHKLIQIPRSVSSAQATQLRVDADVESRHNIPCGEMYIQTVRFSGNKLEHMDELNFTLGKPPFFFKWAGAA